MSAQALFDTLSGGLGLNQNVTNLGDNVLQVGQIGETSRRRLDELKGIFAQPQSAGGEFGNGPQFNISVTVGGRGGAARAGDAVQATNTGSIATYGAQSDAIYAQSVCCGGSGASSTGSASDDSQNQVGVAIGGNGGPVTVVSTGQGTGTIQTQGVAAFGIMAQSVGDGEGSLAGHRQRLLAEPWGKPGRQRPASSA